jgi:hypothetical protein
MTIQTEQTPQDKALQKKVEDLEQMLEEQNIIHNRSTAAVEALTKENSSLLASLKEKEDRCLILEERLREQSKDFERFRKEAEKSVKAQVKAYVEHDEQVKSLKELAEKDRVWLDEETVRRRAASVAIRKDVEGKVSSLKRRLSTAGAC